MWLMYHETGKETYREMANISEEALDECFSNITDCIKTSDSCGCLRVWRIIKLLEMRIPARERCMLPICLLGVLIWLVDLFGHGTTQRS